jgi:hypothetical protein
MSKHSDPEGPHAPFGEWIVVGQASNALTDEQTNAIRASDTPPAPGSRRSYLTVDCSEKGKLSFFSNRDALFERIEGVYGPLCDAHFDSESGHPLSACMKKLSGCYLASVVEEADDEKDGWQTTYLMVNESVASRLEDTPRSIVVALSSNCGSGDFRLFAQRSKPTGCEPTRCALAEGNSPVLNTLDQTTERVKEECLSAAAANSVSARLLSAMLIVANAEGFFMHSGKDQDHVWEMPPWMLTDRGNQVLRRTITRLFDAQQGWPARTVLLRSQSDPHPTAA